MAALCAIFHTPVAFHTPIVRYSLFVLKVPLNTNEQTYVVGQNIAAWCGLSEWHCGPQININDANVNDVM